MAFRLAEVRAAVEETTSVESRKAALAEHDSLIMALWNQRDTLPEPLGVDRRTGLAARIIQQLVSDRSVWSRQETPKDVVEVLGALRDHWAYLLSAAAVLIYKREAVALGTEDPDLPLSKEEREDRKRWDEISNKVLRDIRLREGSLYREVEPSEAEVIVKIEQDVGKTIARLRAHLDTLEPMLLPGTQNAFAKKERGRQ
jgi:(2Fe-2S) ferredoxin